MKATLIITSLISLVAMVPALFIGLKLALALNNFYVFILPILACLAVAAYTMIKAEEMQ